MTWRNHGVFGELIHHAIEVGCELLPAEESRAGRPRKKSVPGNE